MKAPDTISMIALRNLTASRIEGTKESCPCPTCKKDRHRNMGFLDLLASQEAYRRSQRSEINTCPENSNKLERKKR